VRSKRRSEAGAPAIEIPTTPGDVAALRAIRARRPAVVDWRALAQLASFHPESRRRATSEGWEPFRL
jgi:hypothetical protein